MSTKNKKQNRKIIVLDSETSIQLAKNHDNLAMYLLPPKQNFKKQSRRKKGLCHCGSEIKQIPADDSKQYHAGKKRFFSLCAYTNKSITFCAM